MSSLYVLAIAMFNASILSFYGIEVCPFLESLSAAKLLLIIVSHFFIAWLARTLLLMNRRWYKCDETYPQKVLYLDFSIWTIVGFLITFWNSHFYNFPVGSGLKVVLGCLTLGFYTSIYLYLKHQYLLLSHQIRKSKQFEMIHGRSLTSITKKYFIFFFTTIIFTISVLLLLIYKDFEFVIDVISAGKPFMFRWIVQEILFVFGLLLFGAMLLTRQYGKNLKLLFSAQLRVLDKVEKGDLSTFIPVISHDELGLIAKHTNQMVKGLKEKKKIKETFGKYIDASLAQKILEANIDDITLEGKEVSACIIFTDIRNFTAISELLSPNILVKILNEYFSLVVNIIHRNGGIVDKFIGDASMAVFESSVSKNNSSSALLAAIEIHQELTTFNSKLLNEYQTTLETGIGIHSGTVIAGNIGSKDRMEYTFIGDSVNTANRIEEKTKELNTPILLSEDVFRELNKSLKTQLENCGKYSIRGKSKDITLYKLKNFI